MAQEVVEGFIVMIFAVVIIMVICHFEVIFYDLFIYYFTFK